MKLDPTPFSSRRPLWTATSLFLAAALLAGCEKPGGDADDKAAGKDKAAAPAADKPDAAAPGVALDAAALQHAGLVTAQPAAAQWQPEITAYGTVLDPQPLMASLMDWSRAALTFDSSQVELERDKVLKSQNNLSERAFLEAEAVYKQNQAALLALRFQIQTNWGSRIAGLIGEIVVPPGTERKPDPQLVALTEQSSLVRIDLPAGERLPAESQTVQIQSLASQVPMLTATCFDQLPTMDPSTQQESLLCVAHRDPRHPLIPGEAVTARIAIGGSPENGVTVPESAVVRYQGAGWIYVQSATNRFVRQLISLDRPAAGGWFVSEGLSTTNTIIVTGAQTVLSTELSGGGFTTGERD